MQTLPAREGDPEPPPDNGQHIALGCFTEYLRFLERDRRGRLVSAHAARAAGDRRGRRGRDDQPEPAGARCGTGTCRSRDRLRIPLVDGALPQGASASRGETFGHLLRRLGASDAADRPVLGRLHPAGAQPAAPTRSTPRPGSSPFALRLLGPRANSDLVLPTKPLGVMHGDAAGRVLGDRVRLDSKVESLDELDADASSSPCRRPRARAFSARPTPGLEDSPIVSVHLWFDRKLLPQPLAALLGSDAHWVFDRGALTGHEPERGQYLTVVSSGVPELLEMRGRELVDRIAGPADRAARRRRSSSGRASAASRTRPIALRPGVERPGVGDVAAERRPRRDVDGHRLAGDDGERRPQRPPGGSAHLEQLIRQDRGVAAIERARRALDEAIDRGTQRLLELQRPDGVWVGELESNVTMTAQHLFWHHYLGLRTPDLDRRIANELMARMRDDGTWSIWFEGPPDLSTSIEAYVACRLAGVDPGPQALAFIQRQGGIPKARLFTKCFMALIGQWPWQRMAPIPPELVLLPPQWPFSIYDFACWARQTFVALALAQSLRPVRPSRRRPARDRRDARADARRLAGRGRCGA